MKQRGKRRNGFWCLAWYVAPKVSLKTNLAMNQCYITGVLVAAAWAHKGWHERRRRRVCSLPLGECFSVLLSSPKHTQLWWWADGCLCWCMPLLISCCQRWQEVIWWCSPIEKKFRASNWFWHFSKKDAFWLIWTDKHFKENLAL